MKSKKRCGFVPGGKAFLPVFMCLFAIMVCIAPYAGASDPIATGITNAENSLVASNGRIFISGENGFFELKKNNGVWEKTEIFNNIGENCYYLGITEMYDHLFTVCTKNFYNYNADVYLFALDIYSPAGTTLAKIAGNEISQVAAPNGLTSDGAGHLYLADHGALFYPGHVFRISVDAPVCTGELNNPANPRRCSPPAFVSQMRIHSFTNAKANGIKYYNGRLYMTVNPSGYVGLNQLLSYQVTPDKLGDRSVIFSSNYSLDDFSLVEGGYVVAETTGARVIKINENGDVQNIVVYYLPTSVKLYKEPNETDYDLLVTDRAYGQVYLWHNTWGLMPR